MQWKRVAKPLFAILPIACGALVFILSQQVGSDVTELETGFTTAFGITLPSYVFHVAEYMILGFLVANYLFLWTHVTQPLVLSIIIPVIYGVSDEFHQLFIPTRVCAVEDMIANGVGGFVGVVVFLMLILFSGRVLDRI